MLQKLAVKRCKHFIGTACNTLLLPMVNIARLFPASQISHDYTVLVSCYFVILVKIHSYFIATQLRFRYYWLLSTAVQRKALHLKFTSHFLVVVPQGSSWCRDWMRALQLTTTQLQWSVNEALSWLHRTKIGPHSYKFLRFWCEYLKQFFWLTGVVYLQHSLEDCRSRSNWWNVSTLRARRNIYFTDCHSLKYEYSFKTKNSKIMITGKTGKCPLYLWVLTSTNSGLPVHGHREL